MKKNKAKQLIKERLEGEHEYKVTFIYEPKNIEHFEILVQADAGWSVGVYSIAYDADDHLRVYGMTTDSVGDAVRIVTELERKI